MGEGAVGLCHLMHIFLAFECTALVVESVNHLCGELVGHGLATTAACIQYQVLHGYRFLTVGAYLGRHLEGSTADTTALDLDLRSNVLQGFFPDLECGSFLVGKFGLDNLESVIEYGVSCVLFPSYIRWLTNLETRTSLNTGSGRTIRFLGFAFLIVVVS